MAEREDLDGQLGRVRKKASPPHSRARMMVNTAENTGALLRGPQRFRRDPSSREGQGTGHVAHRLHSARFGARLCAPLEGLGHGTCRGTRT